MESPKLNLDMLDVVFSYVSPEHALQFSTVSSAIYEIALRRALTSVRLKDFRKASQFCNFILAYGASRVRFLRGLEILDSAFIVKRSIDLWFATSQFATDIDGNIEEEIAYDFSLAPTLAAVLRRAQCLAYLHISGTETTLQRAPLLGDAIVALSTLRKLELDNVGDSVRALLPQIHSDVRELSLNFGACTLDDIVRFGNLERLSLFRMRVLSCSPTSQWPMVHTLRAGYVTAFLSTFTSAFPNIRILDASEVVEPEDTPSLSGDHPSWQKLDQLILCIRNRQRRWRVSGTARRLSVMNSISSNAAHGISSMSNNQEETLEVVRDTSPSFVSLSINCEVDGQFWTRLAEAGSQLRHMELKLLAARGIPAIKTWMCDVLPHMKGLPLKTLSVCLQRPSADETTSLPLSAEQFFQELGVEIANTITTLKWLSLRWLPRHPVERIQDHTWWIVARDERHNVSKLHVFLPGNATLQDVDVASLDDYLEHSKR